MLARDHDVLRPPTVVQRIRIDPALFRFEECVGEHHSRLQETQEADLALAGGPHCHIVLYVLEISSNAGIGQTVYDHMRGGRGYEFEVLNRCELLTRQLEREVLGTIVLFHNESS